MLELMLCMAILSTVSCIFLPLAKPLRFSSETFVLEALMLQSEAMKEMEKRTLFCDGFEMTYNEMGNVSQAHSFTFDKGMITAQLGWGRLVEK